MEYFKSTINWIANYYNLLMYLSHKQHTAYLIAYRYLILEKLVLLVLYQIKLLFIRINISIMSNDKQIVNCLKKKKQKQNNVLKTSGLVITNTTNYKILFIH